MVHAVKACRGARAISAGIATPASISANKNTKRRETFESHMDVWDQAAARAGMNSGSDEWMAEPFESSREALWIGCRLRLYDGQCL